MQVLCLVQGGAGQLCSWVTSNLTWAAGARLELSISNIQQVLVEMSLVFMMSLLVLVVAMVSEDWSPQPDLGCSVYQTYSRL